MWRITVVVMLLWGLASCELQGQNQDAGSRGGQPPPGKLDFGYVPAGVYETLAHYEPGPIGILVHLVHAFLCVVQPNPFPQDLIVKLAKDRFGSAQTEYQKVMYYELGLLVCAALGLLFAVLVPLVGLLFCMCRCCDNCGGEMHQRQRKNADCRRGLLGALLAATSLAMTIGVLCAYAANQNLSSQVKQVRRLVNSNLKDLHTLATETPVQIDYLISQYDTVKNNVTSDLDNIGPLLGGRIHGQLDKEVRPALDSVLSMAGAMRETREALENASVSLELLQDATGKLAFSLSLVRSQLAVSLGDQACGAGVTAQLCSSIQRSLGSLQISANFTRLQSVNAQLDNMAEVVKTNLTSIVLRGYSSFNNTPAMVSDQTTGMVDDVRGVVNDISGNITRGVKGLPVQSALANFTMLISYGQARVEALYPELDHLDFYRWIGCITLCCMVVLVLAFNFLGLLCGTLGYDKHASPTTRGCISNTGGTLLMAGVGFSFIFSWLLMLVVTVTFVAGGNVEKLLCEPFNTMQLFQVVDAPYLVNSQWKNFIPGYIYSDSELDLTAESLYSDCKQNKGIYSAMRLDKIFNISSVFNITEMTRNVAGHLENVHVNLSDIVLLEAQGKDHLQAFSDAGLSEINYADYLEEVNKGVTVVDLLTFTSDLDTQADLMPQGPLQTALMGHSSTLRQIYSQQVVPLEQAMKYVRARSALNQSMRFLERTASDVPIKVQAVLNAVEAAQFLISQNATWLINQEMDVYKRTIVGYFQHYVEWVQTSLALDVAACKPLSNLLDTAEIMACSFLVDSMNVFWMGLGCSTLFLLPGMVLAVKLAKFYRRMETEDVYDDIQTIPMKTVPAYDTMNRFPRASAPPRHIDW